jgi:hypothetical protein
LEKAAAQGEVIFQDDTPHRILTLIAENREPPVSMLDVCC